MKTHKTFISPDDDYVSEVCSKVKQEWSTSWALWTDEEILQLVINPMVTNLRNNTENRKKRDDKDAAEQTLKTKVSSTRISVYHSVVRFTF